MSTKTTFKRIALVAVSALGFGLLATTAPANAAAGTGSTISSVVVGTIPASRVGETVTIPVTVNTSVATAANETVVLAVKVVSAPSTAAGNTATSVLSSTSGTNSQVAGNARLYLSTSATGQIPTVVYGAYTAANANGSGTGPATGTAYLGSAGAAGSGSLAAGGSGIVLAAAMAVANTSADSAITGYVNFVPDIAGTYSFLVSATSWAYSSADSTPAHLSYVAGDQSATFSVTTGGAPTSLTLTNISGATSHSGSRGALVRVNLVGGSLTGDEAVRVTVSGGYIVKATANGAGAFASGTMGTATSASLDRADFVGGVGFVNVLPTSASQTIIVTATGTGSLSAISNTTTVTSLAGAQDITETTFRGRSGTSVTTGWAPATAGTTGTYTIPFTATSVSIAVGYTDLAPATGATSTTYYGYITVTDDGGSITGAPATSGNTLIFDKGYTATGTDATTETTSVITLSRSAGLRNFSFDPAGATVGSITVNADVPAPSTVAARFQGTTLSAVRAAAGSSVTISALVSDQFGSALAGDDVTVTVAGRNAARTSETLVTNSSGFVTTTITDSGTASATDTVTFAATASVTGSLTITWGAFTVGTVTVTGGSTVADTYKGQNTQAIRTAADGPHGGAVSITATVRDADGNVLSGVPVTFTVSKGLVRKTATIDYTTVYTGSTGTAVTQVIDWTEGEQVITATAGGKSGTDYLTWESKTATDARSITGTASGNRVTANVKDRYGNTVRGVVVTAKTSAGYFGTGTNSTTGTTDEGGNVSFFVSGANGAATVTLSLDKDVHVQSIDKAGEVAATAVTAVVAGTTVGTGASLSAAGVNSVDVAVTVTDAAATAAEAASDAALEAIDAANAATDAANLAAEAADAATVAAEEARDAADAATAAVEALASEVATLIAGLKAQITTLANTVAKIAKRVRA